MFTFTKVLVPFIDELLYNKNVKTMDIGPKCTRTFRLKKSFACNRQ